jgi:putative membrane protein
MNISKLVTLTALLIAAGALLQTPRATAAASPDDDKQFLAMAAQSDTNEIKLSELAETKASSPEVKAFSKKMVADHNMLEMKMKPWATTWGLTPPSGLDSDHQAIYDKLNGLSGADFDKQYMTAMAEDHHKALDAFTKEADTTSNPKFKAAVIKGKAVVASHTTMADSLSAKLM